MPISPEELIARYELMYHVSLATNIDQVRRHGLRSTSALLDLFEVDGPQRTEWESCRRPKRVPLSHPVHGAAFLNDQAPLQSGPLERCLLGMSQTEWVQELNRRVFFFPTIRKVKKFLSARLARGQERIVISIETAALLKLAGGRVELSAINSGSAVRKAPLRGRDTFHTLETYPYEERRKKYGREGAFAELTFPYAVPRGDHFRLATLGRGVE